MPGKFPANQTRRLERRFISLQPGGGSRTITKEAFCSQPEASTNTFIGAYVDRLLEEQRSGSSKGASRGKVGLAFEDFVHIFWVFSASASRDEKEEVVEMLLEPDERGWVDRRSAFRFVKCMLPSVPDRAVDSIVDGITEEERQADREAKGRKPKTEGGCNGDGGRIFIGKFLEREDFVDRLTLHM